MAGARWFALALLLVFAVPGAVEGNLLTKVARSSSVARAAGDLSEEVGADSADSEEGEEGEEDSAESADDEEGDLDAGSEGEDDEGGALTDFAQDLEDDEDENMDGSDSEEEDSSAGELGEEEGEGDQEATGEDDTESFAQVEEDASGDVHGDDDENEEKDGDASATSESGDDIMKKADTNGDGKVSVEELQWMIANDIAKVQAEQGNTAMLRAMAEEKAILPGLFDATDKNKDGFISSKEFAASRSAVEDAEKKAASVEEGHSKEHDDAA